jgi:hypothetical protein
VSTQEEDDMAKEIITLETVRLRLMELHPDHHTSAGMTVWSHGAVHLHLTLHLRERECWSIFVTSPLGETDPQERRVQKALGRALEKVEAGEWQKPPSVVAAELHQVHAG